MSDQEVEINTYTDTITSVEFTLTGNTKRVLPKLFNQAASWLEEHSEEISWVESVNLEYDKLLIANRDYDYQTTLVLYYVEGDLASRQASTNAHV